MPLVLPNGLFYCNSITKPDNPQTHGSKVISNPRLLICQCQVSPGFWRKHKVIKTCLASNEEIQTNRYGFHTIVVKIYSLYTKEQICSLSIWPHNLASAIMVRFTILHGVIHGTVGTFIIVTMLPSMATIESRNSHIMFLNTLLGLRLSKMIRVGICGQTHKISFDRLALG
jgi:hypothetical protein